MCPSEQAWEEQPLSGPPPAACAPPMVYADCRNASAGATGAGCQKSCHTLDMDCVSAPRPRGPTSHQQPHAHSPLLGPRGDPCLRAVGPAVPGALQRPPGWAQDPPPEVSVRLQYSPQCVPGCVCPDGLVADGEGGCIAAADCPCLHNEASYWAGQAIRVGCNTWYAASRGAPTGGDSCSGCCAPVGKALGPRPHPSRRLEGPLGASGRGAWPPPSLALA